MGYDPEKVQWVAVLHRDKRHQHVHLIVSRIRLDGTLVPQEHRDYVRSREVCRALEHGYRLRPVSQTRDPSSRAPTRGEDRMLRERGIPSQKEQLKVFIKKAARGNPTVTEFLGWLSRSCAWRRGWR